MRCILPRAVRFWLEAKRPFARGNTLSEHEFMLGLSWWTVSLCIACGIKNPILHPALTILTHRWNGYKGKWNQAGDPDMKFFEVATSEDVPSEDVETIGEREEKNESGMLHEVYVQAWRSVFFKCKSQRKKSLLWHILHSSSLTSVQGPTKTKIVAEPSWSCIVLNDHSARI